jgi:hypothetical protein
MTMLVMGAGIGAVCAQGVDVSGLATLTPGRVEMQNGLWIEVPLQQQFKSSKRVVIADIKGPAVISMIHFAVPESMVWPKPQRLNRDVLIKMYWDGEESPSVDCPMVDFFCDPAGVRDVVNTALVNKRQGWNVYFPMPFRKSAKIELVYDGSVPPGEQLWRIMPAYSYVIYRTAERIPEDSGCFHAHWRQDGLLLGKADYLALEATGKGKFIGWNVTCRRPGRSGYPVDQNEKFYIDSEQTASVEFMGMEDSFGFSYGFPPTENLFPLTGYFPFLKGGAAAYRFFINDSISFEKSLKVAIGFGVKEDPMFRREFSKAGSELQFSSTVYWYQTEPHAALPPMPPAAARAPAPEEPLWPYKETLPTAEDLRKRGVKFHMLCGRPEKQIIFAEPGFNAAIKGGHPWDGWNPPVYHCHATMEALNEKFQIELTVPKGEPGKLRLYVLDSDNFRGGRRQEITIGGKSLGVIEKFQEGRWLERPISVEETADGKVVIEVKNLVEGGNGVVSIVEWVAP